MFDYWINIKIKLPYRLFTETALIKHRYIYRLLMIHQVDKTYVDPVAEIAQFMKLPI